MRQLLVVVSCPVALFTLAGCPGGDDGGGACEMILPGELVITEIFADYDAPSGSSGADEGKEWFELYNASSGTIDLEGLTITHSRPDGSSDHAHTLGPLTIAAGQYLVMGNVAPEFVEGFLDYGYGAELGNLFNTDGGKLTIGCGSDVIDEALYDEVDAGKATGFDGGATPDYTANDDLVNWCTPPEEAAYEFEQQNFGTPGQANFDCEVVVAGQCNDGGTMRATVPPVIGDLVITEVHPNPSGTDELQEFVEALVTRDIDLNGIGIGKTDDPTPTIVSSEDCLEVTTGTYVVFARSATDNGGLPRVDGVFDAALADASNIQLTMGATVLDAFVWANAPSNASYQLDPDFMDPASNDMERYWCAATVPWAAGDDGSPGAANEECTILPPDGECFDPPGSTTTRLIDPPAAGEVIITEIMPEPTTPASAKEWIEIRSIGGATFDVNGLKLQRLGTTTTTNTIVSADCKPVAANGHALFAKSSVTADNGMLPEVDGVFTLSLIDTCDATVAPPCSIQIATSTDVVLDNITWNNATSKKARQLDPDILDATANDTQANWCDATFMYNTTDTGTPRADNDVQCP